MLNSFFFTTFLLIAQPNAKIYENRPRKFASSKLGKIIQNQSRYADDSSYFNLYKTLLNVVTAITSNTKNAILHPLDVFKSKLQSKSDVNFAEAETNKIFNNAEQSGRHHSVLADESIKDPNEPPFPMHLNTLDAYPNPFLDPLACHNRGSAPVYVCDPDEVLTQSHLHSLENALAHIRATCVHPCGYSNADAELHELTGVFMLSSKVTVEPTECRLVVAVTNNLPPGVFGDEMARVLLYKYPISRADCNDGVLLLYVASKNQIYIHWKNGEEIRINAAVYESLKRISKSVCKQKPPYEAVTEIVGLITTLQKGEMKGFRQADQFYFLTAISVTTLTLFITALSFHIYGIKESD